MAENIIYHYTTAEGLSGIFKHDAPTFHCISSAFQDDASSWGDFADYIRDRLERFNERNDTSIVGLFSDLTLGFVQKYIGERNTFTSPEMAYFANFSYVGDMENQWLARCPHGGFSLGFDLDEVNLQGQLSERAWSQGPVDYVDDSVFIEIIQNEAMKYSNRYVDLDPTVASKALAFCKGEPIQADISPLQRERLESIKTAVFTVVSKITGYLEKVSPGFKPFFFKEEREFRIYSRATEGMDFKVSNNQMLPFRKLQLPQGCLRYVILSPGSYTQAKKTALEMYFEGRGEYPAIKASKCSWSKPRIC